MATTDGKLNDKVRSIKGLRLLTKMGLREAKEFVETVEAATTHTASVPVTADENEYLEAAELMIQGGIVIERNSLHAKANIQQRLKDTAKYAVETDQFILAKEILDLIVKYTKE
jgi:hypothetical protein